MALGTKGQNQYQKVIESATFCLTNFGERGATFQAIAEHCGISQASVVKYLKTRDNIFPTVLEHWLSRARQTTEQSLEAGGSAEDKLRNYLRVSIAIFFERPEINKLYLMLHYFAAIEDRYRVINTQVKDLGRGRIEAIIKEGIANGAFRKVDPSSVAKTIHNSLVGFLISAVTESTKPKDLNLARVLEDCCLDLVRA